MPRANADFFAYHPEVAPRNHTTNATRSSKPPSLRGFSIGGEIFIKLEIEFAKEAVNPVRFINHSTGLYAKSKCHAPRNETSVNPAYFTRHKQIKLTFRVLCLVQSSLWLKMAGVSDFVGFPLGLCVTNLTETSFSLRNPNSHSGNVLSLSYHIFCLMHKRSDKLSSL